METLVVNNYRKASGYMKLTKPLSQLVYQRETGKETARKNPPGIESNLGDLQKCTCYH